MELKRIWMEVKNKYQMRLAAGRKGLERQIDWVHIIEDVQVAEFLRGGELVFTTGIVGREEYLLELGKRLWKKEAAGWPSTWARISAGCLRSCWSLGIKRGFRFYDTLGNPSGGRDTGPDHPPERVRANGENPESGCGKRHFPQRCAGALPSVHDALRLSGGGKLSDRGNRCGADTEGLQPEPADPVECAGGAPGNAVSCGRILAGGTAVAFVRTGQRAPLAGSEWSGSCRWAGTGIWASRPGSAQW